MWQGIGKYINIANEKQILMPALDKLIQMDPSDYTNSRNAGMEEEQKRVGKWAEVAVEKYLRSCGYPTLPVDFDVYEIERKTWKADLPYKELNPELPNIHVKSCCKITHNTLKAAGKPDSHSWTWQMWDELYKNRLNTSMDDEVMYLCCMESSDSASVRLIASAQWGDIKFALRCLYSLWNN